MTASGLPRGGLVLLVGIVMGSIPFLVPTMLSGQEEVTAVLRGRVMLEEGPVRGQMVQLHRVSSDAAGEIDSVATNGDGDFRLVLPYVPDPEVRREVFFPTRPIRPNE